MLTKFLRLRNKCTPGSCKDTKKRNQVPSDAEFDLSDPYKPPPGYNFLHDPHLHEYLNNPCVKRRLTEKGLVTKDGYVKCTIKEFNDYRQWIRKLKLDALDQEWHLNQAKTNGEKKSHFSESVQLSRQRQGRAKELYAQKEKKKEAKRIRYLRYMEQKDLRIEEMKREKNEKFRQRKNMHNVEFKLKMAKMDEKEREGKKIRLKILRESKEGMKKREDRIQSLHQDKLSAKEEKAIDLWRRRQGYSMSQMEELRNEKKVEKVERAKHIQRRESVYQRERRKSQVYMQQFSQENRDNALKHLQEATEFVDRVNAKKLAEIEKWKKRLKNIEAREELLNYYRHKRSYNQSAGKYRRRHTTARKSIWDVDKVLLNEILGEFTDDERRELSQYYEEQCGMSPLQLEDLQEEEDEDMEEELQDDLPAEPEPGVIKLDLDEPEVDDAVFDCIEPEEATPEKGEDSEDNLNVSIRREAGSFISFGHINPDEVVGVYKQARRMSLPHDQNSYDLVNLEIPGLVIEHTVSVHDHQPCVYETSDSEPEEAVVKVESHFSQVSKASSFEIIEMPSQASIKESVPAVDVPEESSEMSIDNVMLNALAKALIQKSLGEAARDIGYSKTDIFDSLGIYFNTDGTLTLDGVNKKSIPDDVMTMAIELAASASTNISDDIQSHAQKVVELALIGAAKSLGYSNHEISECLGVSSSQLSTDDLTQEYDSCIKSIIDIAIYHAALSLGYSDSEAKVAIDNNSPRINSKPSSVTQATLDQTRRSSIINIGKGLAKSSVEKALSKMAHNVSADVSCAESSSTTFSVAGKKLAKNALTDALTGLGIDLSNSSIGTHISSKATCLSALSFKVKDEPAVAVAHNALRFAALSLGYSKEKVTEVIGPEKMYSSTFDVLKIPSKEEESKGVDETKVQKLSREVLTNDAQFSRKNTMQSVAEWAKTATPVNGPPDEVEVTEIPQKPSSVHPSDVSDMLESMSVNGEMSPSTIVLREESRGIVKEVMENAFANFNLSQGGTVPSNMQEEEDAKLRNIAQSLVSSVMTKAVDKMKNEKKQETARNDERRLETLALKLSMLVIGSVGKACGHSDVAIVRALDRDRHDSYLRQMGLEKSKAKPPQKRRGSVMKSDDSPRKTVHHNIKFNEESIDEARRESLTVPKERRASLKDRPLTPKPRKDSVGENTEDENADSLDTLRVTDAENSGRSCESIISSKIQLVEENMSNRKEHAKQRRLTPYKPPDLDKKKIRDFIRKKENANDFMIEEDEEEEEGNLGLSSNEQDLNIVSSDDSSILSKHLPDSFDKKWSLDFIKKIESLHEKVEKAPIPDDVSGLNEAELLKKVQEEIKKDEAILQELTEYPTEADFIALSQKEEKKKEEEKKLVKPKFEEIEQIEELPSQLLELYTIIQNDIDNLLLSDKNSASAITEHLNGNNDSYPVVEVVPETVLNEERVESLPKIDNSSHTFLTGTVAEPTCNKNPSNHSIPKQTSTGSGFSLPDISAASETSLPSTKNEPVKKSSSQLDKLPKINKSSSLVRSDVSNGSFTNKAALDMSIENAIDNTEKIERRLSKQSSYAIGTAKKSSDKVPRYAASLKRNSGDVGPVSSTVSQGNSFTGRRLSSNSVNPMKSDSEFKNKISNKSLDRTSSSVFKLKKKISKISSSEDGVPRYAAPLKRDSIREDVENAVASSNSIKPRKSSFMSDGVPSYAAPLKRDSIREDVETSSAPISNSIKSIRKPSVLADGTPSYAAPLKRDSIKEDVDSLINSSSYATKPIKKSSIMSDAAPSYAAPLKRDSIRETIETIHTPSTNSIKSVRKPSISSDSTPSYAAPLKRDSIRETEENIHDPSSNSTKSVRKPSILSDGTPSYAAPLKRDSIQETVENIHSGSNSIRSIRKPSVMSDGVPSFAAPLKRDSIRENPDNVNTPSSNSIKPVRKMSDATPSYAAPRKRDSIKETVEKAQTPSSNSIKSVRKPSTSTNGVPSFAAPLKRDSLIEGAKGTSSNSIKSVRKASAMSSTTPSYASPLKRDSVTVDNVQQGHTVSQLSNMSVKSSRKQTESTPDDVTPVPSKRNSKVSENQGVPGSTSVSIIKSALREKSSSNISTSMSKRGLIQKSLSDSTTESKHPRTTPVPSSISVDRNVGKARSSHNYASKLRRNSEVKLGHEDDPVKSSTHMTSKTSLKKATSSKVSNHSVSKSSKTVKKKKSHKTESSGSIASRLSRGSGRIGTMSSERKSRQFVTSPKRKSRSKANIRNSLGNIHLAEQLSSVLHSEGNEMSEDLNDTAEHESHEHLFDENTIEEGQETSIYSHEITGEHHDHHMLHDEHLVDILEEENIESDVEENETANEVTEIRDGLDANPKEEDPLTPVILHKDEHPLTPVILDPVEVHTTPIESNAQDDIRSTPFGKSIIYDQIDKLSNSSCRTSPEGVGLSHVPTLPKYVPSPPLNKTPSNMIYSHSFNCFNNRSLRSIVKSKSLGSAGRVMSSSPRSRFNQHGYRELIPMIGTGEFRDISEHNSTSPMVNDVRSMIRSARKTTSSAMWHPTQSVVDDAMDKTSSTALLVQPAPPSRNVSASSIHSGPIVVAPMESINFVASHIDKTLDASDSQNKTEVVEKQISRSDISEN